MRTPPLTRDELIEQLRTALARERERSTAAERRAQLLEDSLRRAYAMSVGSRRTLRQAGKEQATRG
jgi:hypothetical protein